LKIKTLQRCEVFLFDWSANWSAVKNSETLFNHLFCYFAPFGIVFSGSLVFGVLHDDLQYGEEKKKGEFR